MKIRDKRDGKVYYKCGEHKSHNNNLWYVRKRPDSDGFISIPKEHAEVIEAEPVKKVASLQKLLQARAEYNKWLTCDGVDDRAVILAVKLYEQAYAMHCKECLEATKERK